MRELKFRVWNEAVKKMSFFANPILTGDWEDKIGIFFKTDDPLFLSPSSDAMQFTGLKDKNGVDIYEGDILRHPDDEENPFSVFWCDDSAQFRTHCDESPTCSVFETNEALSESAHDCDIAGNIHQNKDLLEESK